MILGVIADDFTGATDVASMLVREGMRTVQLIGVPDAAAAPPAAVDAVVVALKSRTIPADQAVAQSLAAARRLRAAGARQLYFKYCSTFDSTPAGNIGPVAEALLDFCAAEPAAASAAANAAPAGPATATASATSTAAAAAATPPGPIAIACPAFPENGRTVFRGHLFVGDQLLSDSGMRDHPLTPMTDANLVRVLQAQCRASRVGLVRHDTVAQGPAAVRAALDALAEGGHRLAVADAIDDAALRTLGEAVAEAPLLTAGSGVALGLPSAYAARGWLTRDAGAARLAAVGGHAAVLSGSCSAATNAQVAHWLAAGRPALKLDARALARSPAVLDDAVAWAVGQVAEAPVLVYATAEAAEVRAVQAALGAERAGALVEAALARLAQALVATGVRRLVVAGGETSGAVVQALGVQALKIGAPIDPGVPWTQALDAAAQPRPLLLALKSGNFGRTDFFTKALEQAA